MWVMAMVAQIVTTTTTTTTAVRMTTIRGLVSASATVALAYLGTIKAARTMVVMITEAVPSLVVSFIPMASATIGAVVPMAGLATTLLLQHLK